MPEGNERMENSMVDKIKFMEMLGEIKELAVTQNNELTQEEIQNYFEDMSLEPEHYQHIYAYLSENRIRVKGFLKRSSKEEVRDLEEASPESLNQTDSVYLKMYLKELRQLGRATKEEEALLYERAVRREEGAKKELVSAWLFKVVRMARRYKNQGVLLEDLIQEGNIGLLNAVESFYASKEEASPEKYIKEQVKQAMEGILEESFGQDTLENTVIGRSNLINEASRALAEDLGRVATMEELSDYTRLSKEEIEDILKLSLDAVKIGEGE